jgi:hypothetical protein
MSIMTEDGRWTLPEEEEEEWVTTFLHTPNWSAGVSIMRPAAS